MTEGSYMSIQMGAVRIMGKEEEIVSVEKERMKCAGNGWKEEG